MTYETSQIVTAISAVILVLLLTVITAIQQNQISRLNRRITQLENDLYERMFDAERDIYNLKKDLLRDGNLCATIKQIFDPEKIPAVVETVIQSAIATLIDEDERMRIAAEALEKEKEQPEEDEL